MGVPLIAAKEREELAHWFLRDLTSVSGRSYPIDYGLVILHALKHWSNKRNQSPLSDGLAAVQTMLQKFEKLSVSTNKPIEEEDFLEVYHLTGTQNSYCIVDRSNGCYPLILYGTEDRMDRELDRPLAFEMRLKNVLEKLALLLKILDNYKEQVWPLACQDELLKEIPYPKRDVDEEAA